MMRMYRNYGGVSQLMGIVSFFFIFRGTWQWLGSIRVNSGYNHDKAP